MIKLYTGTNCVACKALKKRLHLLGVESFYTECDTADQENRDAIMALGYRSIPVLVKYKDGSVVDTLGGNVHSDSDYEDFFKEFYRD